MNTLMKKLGVGILAVLLLSAPVHAAVITVETWGGGSWGPDPATSGQVDWSAGSAAFTHARNFGDTDVDVTFVPADGYGLTGSFTFHGTPNEDLNPFVGPGGSGSLTNATNGNDGDGANTIDGTDGAITQGRITVGSGAKIHTLTLTGLAASTDYELVLYNANCKGGKYADLSFDQTSFSEGGTSSGDATEHHVDRGNTKVSIAYTTGTNTSVSLNITPEDSGHTWNWYAFSNETIPEPSTFVLAALGGIGLLLRRRRRS